MVKSAVLVEEGLARPYAQSKPIDVRDLELGRAEGRNVRVRVKVAGVCHSDLSVVNGSRSRPRPMVLGHEASGIVMETGSEVSGVKVGDHVAFTFQPHCGECELCLDSGGERCSPALQANVEGTLVDGSTVFRDHGEGVYHHTGVSAFSEETIVHESSVVVIDDDVPFEIGAVLGCAVTTGGGAVKNAARLAEGETVAVVGAGGVGMASALVARALKASRVDIVDLSESKREMAMTLGFDHAYSPSDAPHASYDVVIEAAGVAAALEGAVPLLRPGGRLVSVGLPRPGSSVSVDYLDLVFNNKSIIGSYHGSGNLVADLSLYVSMWRSGALPLEDLITDRIGIDYLNEAFDALSDARVLRQLVMIDAGDEAL
ncbi:alcohol dehydrogenase catalytic domain-containing protein [Cellulosimicrobium funkei]|nr:alcohol dehydrogenase catalytic domain-containing protein [Cellulosimicrobium funkei]